MTHLRLIIRSFTHYFRKNLAVALGVAISTAVLTGALVVGDSMQYTLQKLVDLRLGGVTHTLTAGDRFFSADLSLRMESGGSLESSPVLLLEASAVADGGQKRMPGVQIIGFAHDFGQTLGTDSVFDQLTENEVLISQNLADRLDSKAGDMLLFRIKKASLIPLNAPFVSDEQISLPLRLRVKKVLTAEEFSRFSLQNSQTAPYNAFIPLSVLDNLMELDGKVNTLLINSNGAKSAELKNRLSHAWTYPDAGFKLKELPSGQWQITTDQVFMDTVQEQAIQKAFPTATPSLTYFINSLTLPLSLSLNPTFTPYSFVTGLATPEILVGEIQINQWLADDLKAQPGDSLTMSYFEVGPLRRLTVKTHSFKISGIVPMTQADPFFMPDLPGLSDAGNCRDWETGVPIELEAIRDKDEDYWDEYQGAPKAFIHLDQAKELWGNRFGELTAIRIHPEGFSAEQFTTKIQPHLDLTDLGFVIRDVRVLGQSAAKNGVNFGELFLGLSFFVLIAGLILSILLFGLTIRSRLEQIGLFRSLGFSGKRIQVLLFGEMTLATLAGALIGLLFTWGYNTLIFAGLNSIWFDIVRTDLVFLRLSPAVIGTGLLISVAVSLLSLYLAVRRLLKRQLIDLRKSKTIRISRRKTRLERTAFWFLLALPVLFIGWQILRGEINNPGIFFAAGGMLLTAFTLGADLILKKTAGSLGERLDLARLIMKNMTRNRLESLSVILLLALGTFLVVTVGANRTNQILSEPKPADGTGGFDFYIQTSVPVLKDLNDPAVKQEFNLDRDLQFVQFRQNSGDEASCLNLHAISQPRILGVEPDQLNGRFSFQTQTEWLDPEAPWLSLNQELGPDLIPGIADQTVIQWSLLKKVGDTLWYTGQGGEEFGIILIGGTAASVFQGSLLISEKHFLKHFAASSGSRVMLAARGSQGLEAALNELNMNLRDYGLEIQDTRARLAEFSTINNTYLSIFLLLGALGLLVGTIGLGIVLARNTQDRHGEIALGRAVGLPRRLIFSSIAGQFALLMIAGILIGAVSAIIAVLPGITSPGAEVQIGYLLGIMGIIMANGLIWIAGFSIAGLRKVNLAETLKNE